MSNQAKLWLQAMGLGALVLVALITAGVIAWSVDHGAIIVTLSIGYIVVVMHFKEWLEENDSED